MSGLLDIAQLNKLADVLPGLLEKIEAFEEKAIQAPEPVTNKTDAAKYLGIHIDTLNTWIRQEKYGLRLSDPLDGKGIYADVLKKAYTLINKGAAQEAAFEQKERRGLKVA